MGDIDTLGKILGQSIEKSKQQDRTLTQPGDICTWFQVNYYRLKLQITNVEIEKKDLSGNAFVVGDSSMSQLPVVVGSGTNAYATHALNTDPSSIITDVGRGLFIDWLAGGSPTHITHIEWGTSDIPYNTTLDSLNEKVRSEEITAKAATGFGTIKLQSEMIADSNFIGNLQEIGLFNSAISGDMWFRSVIVPPLTVSETLSIRITVDIAVTDETETSNSLITNYGLNHFADFLMNGTPAFGYTTLSDGTQEITESDNTLDGTNQEKNAITTRVSNGYSVEISTNFGLTEFNDNKLRKVGNFVS